MRRLVLSQLSFFCASAAPHQPLSLYISRYTSRYVGLTVDSVEWWTTYGICMYRFTPREERDWLPTVIDLSLWFCIWISKQRNSQTAKMRPICCCMFEFADRDFVFAQTEHTNSPCWEETSESLDECRTTLKLLRMLDWQESDSFIFIGFAGPSFKLRKPWRHI